VQEQEIARRMPLLGISLAEHFYPAEITAKDGQCLKLIIYLMNGTERY